MDYLGLPIPHLGRETATLDIRHHHAVGNDDLVTDIVGVMELVGNIEDPLIVLALGGLNHDVQEHIGHSVRVLTEGVEHPTDGGLAGIVDQYRDRNSAQIRRQPVIPEVLARHLAGDG